MEKKTPVKYFKKPADLRKWLKENGTTETELWIGFYKKGSGKTAVTYAEALDEALCYGWIDGIIHPIDEESFTRRFTPRKAKSVWSKINVGHVERLIEEKRMTAAGLVHIEAAQKDGRWAKAYDSQSRSKVPDDFLKLLEKNKKAKAFFETLNKANRYAVVFRLQQTKTPEARMKKMLAFIEQFAAGKKIH